MRQNRRAHYLSPFLLRLPTDRALLEPWFPALLAASSVESCCYEPETAVASLQEPLPTSTRRAESLRHRHTPPEVVFRLRQSGYTIQTAASCFAICGRSAY